MKWHRAIFVLMVLVLVALTAALGLTPAPVEAAKPPTKTPTPSVPTITPTPLPVSDKNIVGYFIQWGIYRRNFLVNNLVTSGSAARLTHINYAFADVNASLQCASADPFADYNKAFSASESVDGVADPTTAGTLRGNFNQLRKLKLMYPHLKVLISVGGWSLSDYFSTAARPENRAAFVASCIDMYLQGNFAPGISDPAVFDGIDIDWEYPGACGETCNWSPDDTANFVALMAEFRAQMNALSAQTGKQYLLTFAGAGGEGLIDNFAPGSVHPYVDMINIMAYDYYGGWSTNTGPHAALYGDPASPNYTDHLWGDYAVDLYLSRGVPAGKLNLGVPFYGRGWTGVPAGPNGDGLYQSFRGPANGKWEKGSNYYKDLLPLEASYLKFRHPVSQAFYIYNGSNWWSYDDPTSMAVKMAYIKSKGLGGTMFWELAGDTTDILLLKAIYEGLK